ncbi:SCO6880 family protein [Nocardioides sp. NPDC087217]|uniref:SCO6880 family protein n=1 Tax=Nocardioides sp. NPDC087217 TaxID=3364335 RepID=UPI003808E8D1
MTIYGASATRDRQGWFLGLTGPQLFGIIAAAFPCWLAMAVGEWLYLLVLLPLWVVLVALICIPIRGWSAFGWLGVLLRSALGAGFGWTRFQSKAAAGEVDLEEAESTGEADLPGILAGIQIHDGPPMAGRATRPALIQNRALRTWAATARITHPGIGMADEDHRDLMGAGLAEMLEAATASGQLDLVALQVRTVPDDGTERTSWVQQNSRGDEPEASAAANAQLDAMTAGAAVRREAFITVVVREDVIVRDARRAGRGIAGRARIIYSIMAETEARLMGSIGCTQVTWLDSAELAVAIRTGFEPGDGPALADAALRGQDDPDLTVGIPVAAAGPSNAHTLMRTYRHGEWESVSSTILLPRKGARMGALARMLVPSRPGERRALTVLYRPVSQQTAERATGRAEMSAAMGAEMRRKVGRVERARDRTAINQLHSRDEKLQHGRSLVKATSAVSITVPAAWGAPDYGRRLDASIRLCGFVPLPLDGAHDAAFAVATIPLGVGLPNGRA